MKSYFNGPVVSGGPPSLDVGLGLIPGQTGLNKFGYNPNIGTSEEDIWDVGGDWPGPLDSAVQFNIASTSLLDDGSPPGTGAQTVQIYGLDGSYALADESVTMDGTSDVLTSGSYFVVFRMVVTAAGSTGSNAGNITATASASGSSAMAQITQNLNQTLMACYMVPAGHTLALSGYYYGVDQGGAALDLSLKFLVEPFGETEQVKHWLGSRTEGAMPWQHRWEPYYAISEKSVVKLRAESSAVSTLVYGGFDGVLTEV